MEGVDINVDINIGRHLSALANTLTTFTDVDGEEEDTAAIGMSEIDGPSSAQVHTDNILLHPVAYLWGGDIVTCPPPPGRQWLPH